MTDAPTTPDPIEIAMEAEVAAGRPGAAARLLENQNRLVGWQVASERTGLALKLLTGLAGLALVAVVAAMFWQASRSAGLVVEPFAVPPQLVAEGLSGQVVASKLLDRMATMQSQVSSQRPASSFARTWDGDVKIEIPQTGVTLSELNRELRAWLGHETHITGEVVVRGDVAAVTVRVGAAPGITIPGKAADLDALIAAAGQAAFVRAEPYRYSAWLRGQGRLAESYAVLRVLARSGTAEDRSWAYNGMAAAALDLEGVRANVRYLEEAERIAPWLMLAPTNLGYNGYQLGQYEMAWAAQGRAMRNDTRRAGVRNRPVTLARARGARALITGDYAGALRAWSQVANAGPQGANLDVTLIMTRIHLGLHDSKAARSWVASGDTPSVGQAVSPTRAMDAINKRLIYAAAQGDLAGARAEAARAHALANVHPGLRERLALEIDPVLAEALAAAGDIPGAQSLIRDAPLDSYDNLIRRGRIAAFAGDAAGADRWFAEAARQAPHSAFAETAWAQARLARGETAGAAVLAEVAVRKAPRFADPLEVWGEALLAKGNGQAASAKFAQAYQFAPRWGRLHLKWGEALARAGKPDEAKAQWRIAAGLDLAAAERAELARVSR